MFDSPSGASATLTERQQAVLDCIRSYAAEHGYPPTVREIGTLLGLASSSTVHSHLLALERAGLIQRDPTKPRALKWAEGPGSTTHVVEPEIVADIEPATAIPVVGRVAAGEPLLAEQHVEQYLPVPQMLLRDGESFLLRIVGESMIDAGIFDGDYVVVRRQRDARSGDIVVALVDDDEATCKRLRRHGGKVVLQPENDAMQPIVPERCEILGVVTGLMRSL